MYVSVLLVVNLEDEVVSPEAHLPCPGIEPMSLQSPALADGLFTTSATYYESGSCSSGEQVDMFLP